MVWGKAPKLSSNFFDVLGKDLNFFFSNFLDALEKGLKLTLKFFDGLEKVSSKSQG